MFKFLISFALLLAVSADCGSDMSSLDSKAQSNSQGKNPDGKCYSHVADYIDAVGYGGINKGHFNDAIPSAYWQYAYQFAEYLNQGSNAADLCLANVQSKYSNNPYKAPAGAIVVVRAGTPGTANPVAGDIAVVGGGGNFWNGGEMSYGGSDNFPSSNDYVLGIYVPTTCTPNCNVPYAAKNLAPNNSTKGVKAWIPYRTTAPVMGGSCTGPGEFCCEAPNNDPSNCGGATYSSDCASKKMCCCG
jgi:hypothetical protein